MSAIEELLARTQIAELKARYFRTVDEKDWQGFRSLFSDDAVFEFAGGSASAIVGADAFVDYVRESLAEAVSVHRGTLPELVIDGPNDAHGVWALDDYIEWPPDPVTGARAGFRGHGREWETYRKLAGEWKISAWRVAYDRRDPLAAEPLPAAINGSPQPMRTG